MCQGTDPDPVHVVVPNPKSMGHGKVMPPDTTSQTVVDVFLRHICEKLGSRLRKNHFRAQCFFAGLLHRDLGWLGGRGRLIQATDDSNEIFHLADFLISQCWNKEPVYQIQVTALDPCDSGFQVDLFSETNQKRSELYSTIDEINEKYGEFTIAPVSMLNRSCMPNVISPAWKPNGHRQSI